MWDSASFIMLTVLSYCIAEEPKSWFSDKILCSSECSNLLKLATNQLDTLEFKEEEIDATIHYGPKTSEVVFYQTSFEYIHCPTRFEGGNAHGCIDGNIKLVLSKEDIPKILESNKCHVGKRCDYSEEECLSYSLKECQSVEVLTRWISPRTSQKLKGYAANWFKWFCARSWQCQVDSVDAPIFVERNEKQRMVPFTYDVYGDKVSFSQTKHTFSKMKDDKYILSKPIPLKTSQAKIKCIKGNKNTMCMITKSEIVEAGRIFRLRNDCMGELENAVINVDCNQIVDHYENSKKDGTATNSELTELVNMILFSQLQSSYNLMTIQKGVNEIKKIISEAIWSLSKTNPQLIGELIRVISYTHWTTDGPVICPCVHPHQDFGCDSKKKMIGGIPHLREKGDKCEDLVIKNSWKINNTIKLFGDIKLSFDEMIQPDFIPNLRDKGDNQEQSVNKDEPVASASSTWSDLSSIASVLWHYFQIVAISTGSFGGFLFLVLIIFTKRFS